ncbi:MAG: DUF2892 domain-containing protein [Gammaproteobacteria bacterium]|nr:DUF2892 domain-containing protein [Gammaproteobacteria bacterium]
MQAIKPLIGGMERISRCFLGGLMVVVAFVLPAGTEWFARLLLLATYPLLTALTAWDPVYSLFRFIRERFSEYLFFH